MNVSERMRRDWDVRARANYRWHIASDAETATEFDEGGRADTNLALRGLDSSWLAQSAALEIGCGSGRMTRHLAPRVRSIAAIDVSPEMVSLARSSLPPSSSIRVEATNGTDLSTFQDGTFDLALSYIVFQHVPKHVVVGYIAEVARVLRPGGIFRFQLAEIAIPGFRQPPEDDTFKMRSWSADEVTQSLSGWHDVSLLTLEAEEGTRHLWATARR